MTIPNTMVALMYHALYQGPDEFAALPAEEQPYAVATEVFRAHLDLIESRQLSVVNPIKEGFKPGIVITFDDGHRSFYQHALPLLEERGYSGIFFITPNLVETRDDFCSWEELKQMVDANMSIEAHGQTHQFLSDMTTHEASIELEESKLAIEKACGNEVTTLSFPGGRYNSRVVEMAKNLQYQYCFSSDIGTISRGDYAASDLQQSYNGDPLKRVAIKRTTDLVTFDKIITANRAWFLKAKIMAGAKQQAKRLLGNSGYHRIYQLRNRLRGVDRGNG